MYQPPRIGRDHIQARREDMLRAASHAQGPRKTRRAGLHVRLGKRAIHGGLRLLRIRPAQY